MITEDDTAPRSRSASRPKGVTKANMKGKVVEKDFSPQILTIVNKAKHLLRKAVALDPFLPIRRLDAKTTYIWSILGEAVEGNPVLQKVLKNTKEQERWAMITFVSTSH